MDDVTTPPRDLESLRGLVSRRREDLPERLRQAAAFALGHPEDMAFGTASSLARQAGVQPSTFVRLAQALGYAGFSDLKDVFRTHVRGGWPDYRERIEALLREDGGAGSPLALLHGFAAASASSLDRLTERVSPDSLERAVDVLASARTVYLLGSRRVFPVAAYLAYAFGKLALPSVLVDHVGGSAPEQAGFASQEDALLAISFTPYTPITVEIAGAAQRRGVAVVGITDSVFSPLVPVSRVWLEVAEADHAGFRSLAATFALVMALATAVAERRAA
jgi:DNA-binding MurR/RpiR family transcriptional regulator